MILLSIASVVIVAALADIVRTAWLISRLLRL